MPRNHQDQLDGTPADEVPAADLETGEITPEKATNMIADAFGANAVKFAPADTPTKSFCDATLEPIPKTVVLFILYEPVARFVL